MTKIGLRKAWFQVHKWIGLILSVVIFVISITGAALVWHDPLERAMHPERYAVTGPAALPIDAYAAAAREVLGEGELLQRVEIPQEDGEPVTVSAMKPAEGGGRPERLTVYLDPANGAVLAKASSSEGILRTFHVLHGSLMIPGMGRQIVGWIGVAMLVSSISGIWLWWPVTGSVRRGFRWKRHSNFDTNLHHQLGFWISVPLFVLSATGVWISFPQAFARFESADVQGPGGGGGPPRGPRFAAPLEVPLTNVAPAVASAEQVADGQAIELAWPSERDESWTVTVNTGSGAPAEVKVAAADLAASIEPAEPERPETLARLMRRIHDGNGMPFVWQVIVFLGGLLPAALAVTGVIMWWRARRWREELAERQRARVSASA